MDRKKITHAFEEYVSKYNLKEPNIYTKYVHTGRVAQNCENIARSLNLSEEEVDIAWEIGMLHDIGRFEQLRRFDTFDDSKSIDHAKFGADLLFEEGLIGQFEEDFSIYPLVEKAIRCHSLYRLPADLTEQELMFCQIIRDADKVDIYKSCYEAGLETVYHATTEEVLNSEITPEVYQVFCGETAIPKSIRKTVADHLVGHIALTFELVYPESRELAVEQGYLKKMLEIKFDNPETMKTMEAIKQRIMKKYF